MPSAIATLHAVFVALDNNANNNSHKNTTQPLLDSNLNRQTDNVRYKDSLNC